MPAFGRDADAAAAPRSTTSSPLSARSAASSRPARRRDAARPLFADNCAVCHGADGRGNRSVGAPNLTDPIWLYGGDAATIARHHRQQPRTGSCRAGATGSIRSTIRMLAAYVHSLGGGEDRACGPLQTAAGAAALTG